MASANRYKVLFLSTHDILQRGHAAVEISDFDPDIFDSRLVVLNNYPGGGGGICAGRHSRRLSNILERVYLHCRTFLRYGRFTLPRTHSIYCYFSTDYTKITAQDILEAYGDVPDLIMVYWTDGFLSPKAIRDLYLRTKALVVFVLVDNFWVGGGCHYQVACNNYVDGCRNCPAFVHKRRFAQKQFADRIKYLAPVEKCYISTKATSDAIRKNPVFAQCQHYEYVTPINVNHTATRSEARSRFGIKDSSFVLLYGSAHIEEERKGFKYFEAAVRKFAGNCAVGNVTVLLPGAMPPGFKLDVDGVEVITPGMLDTDSLMDAFYACDIFVSTTLADSGPMMINYSIACARPVISFKVGVALDLVVPGETGYLSDIYDSDSVAKHLLDFYRMPVGRRDAMSAQCLALMESARQKEHYSEWILRILSRR